MREEVPIHDPHTVRQVQALVQVTSLGGPKEQRYGKPKRQCYALRATLRKALGAPQRTREPACVVHVSHVFVPVSPLYSPPLPSIFASSTFNIRLLLAKLKDRIRGLDIQTFALTHLPSTTMGGINQSLRCRTKTFPIPFKMLVLFVK